MLNAKIGGLVKPLSLTNTLREVLKTKKKHLCGLSPFLPKTPPKFTQMFLFFIFGYFPN